jgi:hypothetical protein
MEKITRMCAYLYSLDSFLYRKLNEVMRVMHEKQYESVWKSKKSTLGPFIFLLDQLTPTGGPKMLTTVYRGCNLTTDALKKWVELFEGSEMPIVECVSFPSFTSTSRSREKAEFIGGNVLFIIDINSYHDGWDISPYSQYDEEEFLLRAGFYFHVASYEYDDNTQKWIIHLISKRQEENPLLSDSSEDMTLPGGWEEDVSLREGRKRRRFASKSCHKTCCTIS